MNKKNLKKLDSNNIFDRVVSILEQARKNVVRAVNSNMVLAYWLIGREIVEEIQNGKNRAEYGKKLIKELSEKLNNRYGKGFSPANIANFKQFYLMFKNREVNFYPSGRKSVTQGILYPVGRKSEKSKNHHLGDEFKNPFDPNISWSHYRALMRVNREDARLFYEQETVECGWSKRDLERHIHSQYYERMLKSQQPEVMKKEAKSINSKDNVSTDILKSPYVLEFLGLPDSSVLHETQLESAIITHLQSFLLELGKGFAFVSRQKRLQFEDKNLYVDLVFYNCYLKCYLLIDLKIDELSHKDVGQMDSYVRMFDDLYTADDDNPTIGLILCADKNESVAKYSVLSEREQIFASKYMLYLPTEKELENEIEREKLLIENSIKNKENILEGANE
ncbi:MAG: PDDEXK nuclease domain-containing protein [Candidatus Marinimicrobia bacterium]|nr:PDDEXK nuclease domain-containing protein [Candidatus Neomarinimicrobiota bacterium]